VGDFRAHIGRIGQPRLVLVDVIRGQQSLAAEHYRAEEQQRQQKQQQEDQEIALEFGSGHEMNGSISPFSRLFAK